MKMKQIIEKWDASWTAGICVLVVGIAVGTYYVKLGKAKAAVRAEIKGRGYLRILTLNSPTTYYENRDGQPEGLEYDIGKGLSKSLGVTSQFITYPSVEAILQALEDGKGDIAAAGLVKTKERARRFRFGPPYQKIQQQLVCHRRRKLPRELSQISQVNVLISNDTSYEEQLVKIQNRIPDVGWSTSPLSTEEILEKVWKREVNCTLVDSNIMSINRRYYPELEIAMNIGRPQKLVWVVPKERWGLQGLVNDWFSKMRSSGMLASVIDRYYGHLVTFDYYDAKVFIRRLESRLPQYAKLFESEAEKYGLSWRLLAAMAYQESQWDALARSPTGVRGLMMLTLPTAKSLGVTNRLDPVQSIKGGAKYFHKLRKRLPKEVKKWDRTWLALAAYNVGYGHLKDAQILARRFGKDPYRWEQLKEVLPLLSNRLYYSELPHGYARGSEPVRYVHRIRNYELLIRVYHR